MTKLGELAAADARLGPGGWEAEGQDVVDENGTLLCRVDPPTVVAYLAACEPARIQRLLAVLEAARAFRDGAPYRESLERIVAAADACDADPLLARGKDV